VAGKARLVSPIDRDLETLAASKTTWARLPVERKIAILETVKRNAHAAATEWVALAVRAKRLAPSSPLAGEEWISGPWAVLYALNRYLRTLRGIARRGEPPLPPMRRRRDGRIVLRLFPHDLYDRALLSGIRADVWMKPGLSPNDVRASAASFYRTANPPGGVALVLGAGNISSIAPLDVLYKMLADGCVCMLKMNPVNAYLGPVFERIFQPLYDGGFLRFAYGGAEAGAYLCAHAAIENIHITGSEATHNAIASGSGAGKPITSELGNVSPTIVLPGPWTTEDIDFQAQNIATQKAHNAGFNCIASQVVVLPKEWTHTNALRDAIARVFARMEPRPEYYPGAAERRRALAQQTPELRALIDVDPADADHPAFANEAFCGVLACVQLPGGFESYLHDAVTFANARLHGTLGANVVVHPATLRECAPLIDDALAQLRYGCIGVNAWTGVGYFLNETPWGAYPGHTLADIQSGIGVVHNSYFLQGTEKSIVRAPFAPFPRSVLSREFTLLPKPPWFVTNRRQAQIGRALCDFEVDRSPLRAAAVAALALSA
jgi:aldehyde dehydrogenase (NAD(P)+)